MSGGGARAAYRAGVLQAMSRILEEEAGRPPARDPFAAGTTRDPMAPGRAGTRAFRDGVLECFA